MPEGADFFQLVLRRDPEWSWLASGTTHKFNWIANRRPYYHYYYNYIFMNDAKEGRNEGSLVETGVYITLINIFGPMYLLFCFSCQLRAAVVEV